MVQFLPSLIVSYLLKTINESADSTTYAENITKIKLMLKILQNKGFLLSILLFTCLCGKTVIENQYFDSVSGMGAEIRGTLSSAIYRKSLKLNQASRQNNTVN